MKKKVALSGVFVALALICSYIESLIPFYFGIPGMKLGLTNIVILLLLYYYSWREALLVSVMRILLAGFMFGNGFSILYSLAGGLLSLFGMALLKHSGKFQMMTISICGGILHNLGQILVAVTVMENVYLMGYFPFLFIGGGITGFLIGLLAQEIYNRTRTIIK